MKLLNRSETMHVSGGDHQLKVVIDAPTGDIGNFVGLLMTRMIDGNIKTNADFLYIYNFITTMRVYLPGTHLVSVAYT